MDMRIFIPVFVAMVLSGCGGGNAQGSGSLMVGMTDAPVDNADAVVIHFTEATLHGEGGNTVIEIIDPVSAQRGRDIDLLQFQAGMWTGLFEQEVVAGQYSWIRLQLDLSKSYIQIAGQRYDLRCTSCEHASFRLNQSFNVEKDARLTLMLDFDLRKSITDPTSGADYILRPTVRVVDTAVAGGVEGNIDATIISSLGGFTGCSVYAFSGYDAELDDIYISQDGTTIESQNNPVSSTQVQYINDVYSYRLAYMPEGNYSIALTCDADMDSAATDDVLTFSDQLNISVNSSIYTKADINQ